MKVSLFKKIVVSVISVLIIAEPVLAQFSESTIWMERRNTSRKPDLKVASLPTMFTPASSVLQTLPINKLHQPLPKPTSALKNLLELFPQNAATVQETYEGKAVRDAKSVVRGDNNLIPQRTTHNEPRTVVLIQDIHLNTEAQKNISTILLKLMEKQAIDYVGVEGAFKTFDFNQFRSLPNKKRTDEVTRSFLDQKKLAAPSYAGIISPTAPPLFVGVDNRQHYDMNVKAYRSTLALKSKIQNKLNLENKNLEESKTQLFSRELKQFDELRSSYRLGRIGIGEYVERVSHFPFFHFRRGEPVARPTADADDFKSNNSKNSLSASPYQEINLFLEAYRLEKSLDFHKVDLERRVILDELTKKLTEQELSIFLQESLSYRLGSIGFGSYYQHLKNLCESKNIPIFNKPNFNNYIRYVLLSDRLNGESLFNNIDKLERDLANFLVKTPEERTLLEQSDQLVLIQKLIDFSLSPKEWIQYKAHKTEAASRPYDAFERFYEEADIRSEKMVENLTAVRSSQFVVRVGEYPRTTHHDPRTAVLIVGGFHTPQIAKLLKEKNISYIILSPKITKIDDLTGSAYLTEFAKQKTPLDKLFAGEKLFLALEDQNITSVYTEVALHAAIKPVSLVKRALSAFAKCFISISKTMKARWTLRSNEIKNSWIQENWRPLNWWIAVIAHTPKNFREFVQLNFDYALLLGFVGFFGYGLGLAGLSTPMPIKTLALLSSTIAVAFGVFPAHLLVNSIAVTLGIRSLTEKNKNSENKKEGGKTVFSANTFNLLRADYGFLSENHEAVKYVQGRIRKLFPDLSFKDVPPVHVLAKKGYGINATAFINGHIVISPELLNFIKYNEELDFVLLHEINHLTQNHLSQINDAFRRSSYEASALGRYSEYESDMIPFYQMSEEKRGSSSRGAIVFLERLRRQEYWDEGQIGWDAHHGEITDRILNLKTVLFLLDFANSENELTLKPVEILSPLENLKKAGGLTRLFSEFPDVSKPEKVAAWKMKVQKIAAESSEENLIVFLNVFSENIAQIGLDSDSPREQRALNALISDSFNLFFKEWRKKCSEKYSSLSSEDQVLAQIILIETKINIPFLTNPKHSAVRQLGETFTPVLKKIRQDYLNLSDGESQAEKPFLKRLHEVLKTVSQDHTFDQSALYSLLSWISIDQLQNQAAFDNPEGGILFSNYLSESYRLLKFASHLTLTKKFEERSPLELIDAWSLVYCSGVLTLIDLDEWDTWKSKSKQKAMSLHHDGLSPTAVSALLPQFDKENKEATELLLDHLTKDWNLNLSESMTIGNMSVDELIEQIGNLFDEINGDTSSGFVSKERAEEFEKLSMEEIDAFAKEHRKNKQNIPADLKTWKLLAASMQALPDNFYIPYGDTFVENKEIRKGRKRKLIIDNGRLVSRSQFKRDIIRELMVDSPEIQRRIFKLRRLVAEEKNEYYDESANFLGSIESLEELEEFINLSNDIESIEKEFGVRANLQKNNVNLVDYPIISGLYFRELASHLEGVKDDKEWFDLIDHALTFCPLKFNSNSVFSPASEGEIEEDPKGPEAIHLALTAEELQPFFKVIILKGIERLEKLKLSRDGRLRKILSLSFFLGNEVVKIRLQEYLVKELIQALSLKESLFLLSGAYPRQSLFFGKSVFNLIERKAKTPEDFDQIKNHGKSIIRNISHSPRLGMAVSLDGAATLYRNPVKKFDLFFSLLTSRNDQDLRTSLADSWFKMNMARLIRAIDAAELEKIKTPRGLNQVANSVLEKLQETFYFRLPTPTEVIQSIYLFSMLEKKAALRKLTTGEDGVLVKSKSKSQLVEKFFEQFVDQKKNPDLSKLIENVFGAVLRIAPSDELYLLMSPILETHFAIQPGTPQNWDRQIESLVKKVFETISNNNMVGGIHDFLLTGATTLEEEDQFKELEGEDKRVFTEFLKKIFSNFFSTENKIDESANKLSDLSGFKIEPTASEKPLSPLELVTKTAKQLGAPGVRFLQLLGQTVSIPSEYREEFFKLYDEVEGQSVIAGWESLRKYAPEYAAQIKELGARIGGGSLYSVFEVTLKGQDRPTEIVRILNPNALLIARQSIEIIQETLENLAEEDPMFNQAKPLVNLLQEWIEKELSDPTYAEDDAKFFKDWNNKSLPGFKSKILIPKSRFDGIPLAHRHRIRREQYVPAKTFKKLDKSNPEHKRLTAFAAQFYLQQLKGSRWGALSSILRGKKDQDISLVLSDLSPGNFGFDEKNNLVVYDRGMYLKFDLNERLFAKKLFETQNLQDRVSLFVNWVVEQNRDNGDVKNVNVQQLIQNIVTTLEQENKDPEEVGIEVIQSIQKNGFIVPLKYNLLFKNINFLNRLSREMGFGSLRDALEYSEDGKKPLNAGVSYLTNNSSFRMGWLALEVGLILYSKLNFDLFVTNSLVAIIFISHYLFWGLAKLLDRAPPSILEGSKIHVPVFGFYLFMFNLSLSPSLQFLVALPMIIHVFGDIFLETKSKNISKQLDLLSSFGAALFNRNVDDILGQSMSLEIGQKFGFNASKSETFDVLKKEILKPEIRDLLTAQMRSKIKDKGHEPLSDKRAEELAEVLIAILLQDSIAVHHVDRVADERIFVFDRDVAKEESAAFRVRVMGSLLSEGRMSKNILVSSPESRDEINRALVQLQSVGILIQVSDQKPDLEQVITMKNGRRQIDTSNLLFKTKSLTFVPQSLLPDEKLNNFHVLEFEQIPDLSTLIEAAKRALIAA